MTDTRTSCPDPKRRRTTKAHGTEEILRSSFDNQAFPHILDALIEAASPVVLRALRRTCHEIKNEIDNRLSAHCFVTFKQDTYQAWLEQEAWGGKAETGGETLRGRPDVLQGTSPAALIPRDSPPRSTQVLDINAHANTMFYYHVLPYTLYKTGGSSDFIEDMLEEGGPPVKDCLDLSVLWFDMSATLVRCTPCKRPNNLVVEEDPPLRKDAVSVYFYMSSFEDTLCKLGRYYDTTGVGEELDIVFNVSLAPEDDRPWGWPSEFPGILCNRVTVLFSSPNSAHPFKQDYIPSMLATFIQNYIVGWECRATIVGYETWSRHMLPEPDDDDYWDAAAASEVPDRSGDTAERRLKWWVDTFVESILEDIEDSNVNLQGQKFVHDPIRLLTFAEWKEQVGDTYFELMTDPRAVYFSKHPLPKFNSVVEF